MACRLVLSFKAGDALAWKSGRASTAFVVAPWRLEGPARARLLGVVASQDSDYHWRASDPMVSVMKLDKAPTESYADIGGLDSQIQEIKVSTLYLQFPLITKLEF